VFPLNTAPPPPALPSAIPHHSTPPVISDISLSMTFVALKAITASKTTVSHSRDTTPTLRTGRHITKSELPTFLKSSRYSKTCTYFPSHFHHNSTSLNLNTQYRCSNRPPLRHRPPRPPIPHNPLPHQTRPQPPPLCPHRLLPNPSPRFHPLPLPTKHPNPTLHRRQRLAPATTLLAGNIFPSRSLRSEIGLEWRFRG
jgi:hypothetical protein